VSVRGQIRAGLSSFPDPDIWLGTSPSRAFSPPFFEGPPDVIDDQEFAAPLVGSKLQTELFLDRCKDRCAPAGSGGVAPLTTGAVSSGACSEIPRCSARDTRSFYHVEIVRIAVF
jgi:hypothetical protein